MSIISSCSDVREKHEDLITKFGDDVRLDFSYHDCEVSGDLAAARARFKVTDGAGKLLSTGKCVQHASGCTVFTRV